jgi:hypothetical protein
LNTERLLLQKRDRFAGQVERRVRQQRFRTAISSVTPRSHACVTVVTFHVTACSQSCQNQAEVDKNSGLNVNKTISAMKADLFREFNWSSKEGTFVQVAFPGLFPDLTRWQAEQDQLTVNQGQHAWKNDPAQVARNLAVKLLTWSASAQTTVLSGGGPREMRGSSMPVSRVSQQSRHCSQLAHRSLAISLSAQLHPEKSYCWNCDDSVRRGYAEVMLL